MVAGGEVEGEWPQLSCVHSGNYKDLGGEVDFNEAGYARYVDEFFPADEQG